MNQRITEQPNVTVAFEGAADAIHGPGICFACPACHRSLCHSDEQYTCLTCQATYPIHDGVPDFASQDQVSWGELSAGEMAEAIAIAGEKGYEAAAHFAASRCPSLRQYLMAECRVDWLFHSLSLDRHDRCLDIGSGWGTLSRSLASFFTEVFSLELVPDRVKFQSLVQRQERLAGLTVVRGSAVKLPFADSTFDLVIANGIIQWVGLADHDQPVETLQRTFLDECARVLRPGGILVMGCENRAGVFHYLGATDHSGLPFTSLLPRSVADWVVKRFRRTGGRFVRGFRGDTDWKDYRTYTYTPRGYEKLIRRSGFQTVTGYWAYPSNNLPGLMGRLDDGRSISDVLQFASKNLDFRVEGTNFSRIALRLRALAKVRPLMRLVLRWLTPDMFFVARRPTDGTPERFLDSAVGDYTLRWSGSNKLVWIGYGETGSKRVTKAARRHADEAAVHREETLLARYNGIDVSIERYGTWTLFREPFLASRPMDCLSPLENRQALDWLLAFQHETTTATNGQSSMIADVECWLRRFSDLVTDASLRKLAEADCDAFTSALSAAKIPITAEHGDFWRRNLLFGADGRLDVLDWQHFRQTGDPIFDFSLLTSTLWEMSQWMRSRRKPMFTEWPLMEGLVAEFARHYGFSKELVYAYYPYAMIRRIARSTPLARYDLLQIYRRHTFPTLRPAIPECESPDVASDEPR